MLCFCPFTLSLLIIPSLLLLLLYLLQIPLTYSMVFPIVSMVFDRGILRTPCSLPLVGPTPYISCGSTPIVIIGGCCRMFLQGRCRGDLPRLLLFFGLNCSRRFIGQT